MKCRRIIILSITLVLIIGCSGPVLSLESFTSSQHLGSFEGSYEYKTRSNSNFINDDSHRILVEDESGYAEFKISNLRIDPEKAETGEDVVVRIDVTNIGEETGDYTVEFYLDGEHISSDSVTLEGGETVTVTLVRIFQKSGNYEFSVEDEVKTITVEGDTDNIDYILLFVIALMIFVVIILVIIYYKNKDNRTKKKRKKRKKTKPKSK